MQNNQSPIVFTLILNWNGKHDTLECLESLQAISYKNNKIIVVDNGSTDDSVSTISTLFPEVTILETNKNLGYAGGNNIGILHALQHNADYILILNNDTTVSPDIIDCFIESIPKDINIGALNPKIYFHEQPNRIWSAGGYWDEEAKCFKQIGENEIDIGQFDKPRKIEFAVGCALFFPRKTFEQVGLFEPDFFLNYEEIDFCNRIIKSGLNIFYVPKPKVWHKISVSFGGETSPLKYYYTFRNRLLWANRNLTILGRVIIHISVYKKVFNFFIKPLQFKNFKEFLWSFYDSIRNPTTLASLTGIIDYWLGNFGECPHNIYEHQKRWKKFNSRP